MTRTLTLAVALALLFGAVWWLGNRNEAWRANIERMERDAATQERIRDADRSTGDPDDDRAWLGQLIERLRSADQ